jgi:tetratricopeptide (TPR) repeat protein
MDIFDKIEEAQEFIDAGNYPKAIDCLTEIISGDPADAQLYIQRGYTYFCMDSIDEAIVDFTKAIGLDDEPDTAYWYLSQIYSLKAEFNKAKEYIIKAIEIDNENFNYLGDYAIIEQNLKNYNKSIELFGQILSHYPADTFALNHRGYCFLCINDYKSATRDFERALFENRYDPITLNNLGYALTRTGENNKAYRFFQSAVQIDPGFAYAYDNLGYLYYLDHNYDQASTNLNKSIELDDSNCRAYKNRALVFKAMAENENARADLQKAISLGYTAKYDDEAENLLKDL